MNTAQTALADTGWLTISSAAAITGYTPEYLRQLARTSAVAVRKEGIKVLISQESLMRYQASRTNPTASPDRTTTPTNKLGIDPRLTSDPYLSDAAVRRQRNAIVIAHLDALSSATSSEVEEQRETYQQLRKRLDEDRLSDRPRFRALKNKARKGVKARR